MSHINNDELVEAARFYQEEWTGTIMEKLLQFDIDQKDYDSMYEHVNEARKMSFERDYHPELESTGFNDVG